MCIGKQNFYCIATLFIDTGYYGCIISAKQWLIAGMISCMYNEASNC